MPRGVWRDLNPLSDDYQEQRSRLLAGEGDHDDTPRFDQDNLSVDDRRRMNRRTIDGSMTFALLLYVNIFYFALYAGVELFLLLFKAYNMTDHPKHGYSPTDLINELALLAFMVVVEAARLVLGNKHDLDGFDKNLQNLFRILVLTVPSIYSVAYFTLWQHLVLRIDAVLGSIMLIIQSLQFISAFYNLSKKYLRPKKQN